MTRTLAFKESYKKVFTLKERFGRQASLSSPMMSYNVEDFVHGSTLLPSYVLDVTKSKAFQRLRKLNQLGVSNFVFESANHCRAEHCIGTATLCQQLLDIIERNSGCNINELHRKCVILAALLHDVGHGPFSHLWEGVVHQGPDINWTHEQQSHDLIEHMIRANGISLHELPEKHKYALKLITSLITADSEAWQELLKPEEMFITEIVSNKFCKIDVDKCDYILRDTHHVQGFVTIKPFIMFLQQARIVFDSNGTSHIGYHVEDFKLIENLFYNRAYLHMNIYQHFKVAGAERMVKDICVKASAGGIKIADLPLTEVHRDCEAYLQLDDSVLDLIEGSCIDNALVRDAQKILESLKSGRLYNMVYEAQGDSLNAMFNVLVKKFGPIFCIVAKEIPQAEVPSNVPLYNDNNELVQMTSSLQLSYNSQMIYCVDPDFDVSNINSFISSLNNNI